jgi:hypothetical protein
LLLQSGVHVPSHAQVPVLQACPLAVHASGQVPPHPSSPQHLPVQSGSQLHGALHALLSSLQPQSHRSTSSPCSPQLSTQYVTPSRQAV